MNPCEPVAQGAWMQTRFQMTPPRSGLVQQSSGQEPSARSELESNWTFEQENELSAYTFGYAVL
ncbi:MAG: hypothetical protein HOH33_05850 [Verrucomicrobia bacterium]|nr:hypothetical protein [Verrucomicrobiota bacterium]